MSRPLRIQFSGAVYHVMNRGAARQPTYLERDAILEEPAEKKKGLLL
jgi:hypothetical protein